MPGLPLCLLPNEHFYARDYHEGEAPLNQLARLLGLSRNFISGKLITTVSIYGLIIVRSDRTPIKVKVGGRNE